MACGGAERPSGQYRAFTGSKGLGFASDNLGKRPAQHLNPKGRFWTVMSKEHLYAGSEHTSSSTTREDERARKVAELKRAVRNGTYQVRPHELVYDVLEGMFDQD